MNVSEKGTELIKHFESCSLVPYLDSVKIPTIGWGSTFYANGTKVTMKDKAITQKEADILFLIVLRKFEKEVNTLLKVELTQNQYDALLAFSYNVGVQALKGSTLLKKLNTNPKDPTIKDEWMKWVKAGSKVLKGLQRRRASEYHLFAYNELNYYEIML